MAVTASFLTWLKSSSHMKLASEAAANRIIAEGITDFKSLNDFDDETIHALPKSCTYEIPVVLQNHNANP